MLPLTQTDLMERTEEMARERQERQVDGGGRIARMIADLFVDVPISEERRAPRQVEARDARISFSMDPVQGWGEVVPRPPDALGEPPRIPGISVFAWSITAEPVADDEAHVSLRSFLDQCTTREITAVQTALRDGQFDAHDGTRCLFGIIAHARGTSYGALAMRGRSYGTKPPIERWLMEQVSPRSVPLQPRHTPATHAQAARFDAWLTDYLVERGDAPPPAPPLMLSAIDTTALEAFRRASAEAFDALTVALGNSPLVSACERGIEQGAPRPCLRITDEDAHASLLTILDHCTPHEVLAVRRALRRGSFDGGDTDRCLFGIIARCRHIDYMQLIPRLGICMPPIERWVGDISRGHTPHTHDRARLLDQWLTAWLNDHTLEVEAPLERVAPPYEWDEDRRRLLAVEGAAA